MPSSSQTREPPPPSLTSYTIPFHKSRPHSFTCNYTKPSRSRLTISILTTQSQRIHHQNRKPNLHQHLIHLTDCSIPNPNHLSCCPYSIQRFNPHPPSIIITSTPKYPASFPITVLSQQNPYHHSIQNLTQSIKPATVFQITAKPKSTHCPCSFFLHGSSIH
jgi:hypothetical protein